MTDAIFGGLERDWARLLHHHHEQPAYHQTSSPTAGDTMNLTGQLTTVKEAATQGTAWHDQLLQRLEEAIRIISAFEASPIVQALQAAVLGPEVEAAIAATIKAAGTPAPQAQPPADGGQASETAEAAA